MRAGHRGHAQEDEDERLAHAAPHLQEVFDGGVRLVGDVGLHVRPHHHAARDQPGKRAEDGELAHTEGGWTEPGGCSLLYDTTCRRKTTDGDQIMTTKVCLERSTAKGRHEAMTDDID